MIFVNASGRSNFQQTNKKRFYFYFHRNFIILPFFQIYTIYLNKLMMLSAQPRWLGGSLSTSRSRVRFPNGTNFSLRERPKKLQFGLSTPFGVFFYNNENGKVKSVCNQMKNGAFSNFHENASVA
uniref:Uncharacterized protein n=1 Tax=Cacopsylla melanoneura TaxID=428564 RepID=A0A8D8WFX6_9HEMI